MRLFAPARVFPGTPFYSTDDDAPFDLGPAIGEGSFARVVVATARDGSRSAAKIFRRRAYVDDNSTLVLPRSVAALREECAVARLVGGQHHCVAWKGFHETPSRLLCLYELCDGSLDEMLGPTRVADDLARRLAAGLLDALAWCHACRVAHRDVKPENVLLAAGDVRLADWGSARRPGASSFGADEVSGFWAAPEVLRGLSQNDIAAAARTDDWAAGLVILALVAGNPSDDDVRALHGGGLDALPGDRLEDASGDARAVSEELVQPDPVRRATARDALALAWFDECRVLGSRGSL